MVCAGVQTVRPSSATFLGILAGAWTESGAAWSKLALACNAGQLIYLFEISYRGRAREERSLPNK